MDLTDAQWAFLESQFRPQRRKDGRGLVGSTSVASFGEALTTCTATGRPYWKIERLFAWLHNYRRIVIRWEYYPENFLEMVQLACAVILLRHL
jgi:transposase